MNWRRFSPVQQSMIASHLAGGGSFCCANSLLSCLTVTSSAGLADALSDHAYENWGCGAPSRTEHYLTKFLDQI